MFTFRNASYKHAKEWTLNLKTDRMLALFLLDTLKQY